MKLLYVRSTLPEEIEIHVRNTIGCCLAVHRELGCGLSENVYSRAVQIEFDLRGISFVAEKLVPVRYQKRLLCHQRIDLLVEDAVVLEVKSVEHIHPVHVAQVVSYLRLTGLRAGLVINFNVPLLRQGIRRVVL